ncbi:MAG: hypothetical protein HRU19_00255 [Pseudobacteriovorax sp.]|nr:hypothetical protein [Pseudobacteriovorax sp.]
MTTMTMFSGSLLGKSYPYSETTKLKHVVLEYIFQDEYSFGKKREISQLINKAFPEYVSIFGGLPRDLNDKPYRKIKVNVKQGEYIGGEADPGVIQLTLSEDVLFGFAGWKAIVLHELFHLWNAETIRYKSGLDQWFNEGFTEFYTYQVLTKLKLLTPKQALNIALYPIGYYSSAKGLGKISMRDAGKDNKSKFDHYFLIYHGGWVAAMVLDYRVRKDSNNKQSLDSLMKWLYKNFVRSKKLYTIGDIIAGLKETTGFDYRQFFSRYISGTEVIPIADYFNLGKIIWTETFEQIHSRDHEYLFWTLGIRAK